MRKTMRGLLYAGLLLGSTLLCGCGGKQLDEASTRVIGLTITPAPTPTPTPADPTTVSNASVSSNGVTMTNQYLLENGQR